MDSETDVLESAERSWLATRVAIARVAGLPDRPYVEQALAGDLFPARIRRSPSFADTDSLEPEVVEATCRMGGADARPWPTPLARALRELIDEREGTWMRLAGRVKDALEVFLKYAATIALCDVLDRKVPPALRDALATSIIRPSLGHWVFYGRSAAEAMDAGDYFVPALPEFFRNGVGKRGDAISAFRNAHAHAATQPEDQYARDFLEGLELLFHLMRSGANVWKGFRLVGFDDEGAILGEGCDTRPLPNLRRSREGTVLLLGAADDDRCLDLSPLLVYRLCQARIGAERACGRREFLFFNDRKKETALTYLDYPVGHLGRDRDMLEVFEKRFRVWILRAQETFESTILDRTDDFVGRETEIDLIRKWVGERTRGTILVTGEPGCGKSALVSALCRIGSETLIDDFEGPNYVVLLDSNAWGNPAIVRYFIRRTEATSEAIQFLRATLEGIAALFHTAPNLSGDASDLFRELEHQLDLASRRIAANESAFDRLLILVDGLDESLSESGAGDNRGIAPYLPRHLPAGVHLVVSSRPCDAIEGLKTSLSRAAEPFEVMELKGLDRREIREFLSRTVSHFGVTEEYVQAVHQVSEGNPHYLKLLAEELVEGRRPLNELSRIPSRVEEVYEDIRERCRCAGGQPALDLLATLALGREMFSLEELARLLCESPATTEHLLSVVSEVVSARHGHDGRRHYRLFHEKFREFIRDDANYRGHSATVAARMLAELCARGGGTRIDSEEINCLNRVISGECVQPGEVPTLAASMEQAARTLTGFQMLRDRLMVLAPNELARLVPMIAPHVGPGGGRLLTELVKDVAQRAPDAAAVMMERLIAAARGHAGAAATTSARIALESCSVIAGLPQMAAAVRRTCLSACVSPDDNTKTLGVNTLVRLRKVRHEDGMAVLRDLSEQALCAGLPRPSRLLPYVSGALGMFFESSSDPRLREDLKGVVRGTLRKLWWKGVVQAIGPRIAARLQSTGTDDFNPMNFGEIRHHKSFVAARGEMALSIERMLEYANPSYGSDAEFETAVQSFYIDDGGYRDGFAMYALQAAVLARALNGREAALESSWRYSLGKTPGDHAALQDFLFQLRITQLALKIRRDQPLDPIWTHRAEEIARRFFYDHGAVFRIGHRYIGGGLIPGTVFLAHQRGSPDVACLQEFVDWTYSEGRPRVATNAGERKFRPDAVLLRTIEVIGLEYGAYDPLARDTARFGLGVFLNHADTFDSWTWHRVVNVLARMRTYAPEEVDHYLANQDPIVRQHLEARLQQELPKESLDTLLSMRSEFLYATVLGEAPDENGGLRPEWCRFLKVLLGPQSPAATYRDLSRRLMRALEE